MNNQTNIILVDDHVIVRKGLKELIESLGNYHVVAEYDNGKAFVDSIPATPVPDLVILDLDMPIMNGKQTAEWLKKNHAKHKVLVLTLDTTDKTIIELFRLGIKGYLTKNCTADTLKDAIDSIVQEGYYHSELLTKAVISESNHRKTDEDLAAQITEKERRFINLLCDEKEYTYDEIASQMSVSRPTVENYRKSLFEKLNIRSKTGLVLFAIKHGIVDIRNQ
jgi:two-component system invasion response regulator UvrY